MNGFSDKICKAYLPSAPKVSDREITQLLLQQSDWALTRDADALQLCHVCKLIDFATALALTDAVSGLAEAPALLIVEYGKVTGKCWSHKRCRLRMNHLIVASRADALFERHCQQRATAEKFANLQTNRHLYLPVSQTH